MRKKVTCHAAERRGYAERCTPCHAISRRALQSRIIPERDQRAVVAESGRSSDGCRWIAFLSYFCFKKLPRFRTGHTGFQIPKNVSTAVFAAQRKIAAQEQLLQIAQRMNWTQEEIGAINQAKQYWQQQLQQALR